MSACSVREGHGIPRPSILGQKHKALLVLWTQGLGKTKEGHGN